MPLVFEHPICGPDDGLAGRAVNTIGSVFTCFHVSNPVQVDYCQPLMWTEGNRLNVFPHHSELFHKFNDQIMQFVV